jgi:putative ABC transport system permease protein
MPLVFAVRFVLKRIWYHRMVLLLTMVSVLAITTIFSGVPLFANAVNTVNLQAAIRAPVAPLRKNVEVRVSVPAIPQADYRKLSAAVTDSVQTGLGADLLTGPPIREGRITLGFSLPAADQAAGQIQNNTTTLWFSSSLNLEHIALAAGHLPASTVTQTQAGANTTYEVEALLPSDWADVYHFKLGDVLYASDTLGDFKHLLEVHLVGLFQPKSLQDPAWFGDTSGFDQPDSDPPPPLPLWLDESAFEVAIPPVLVEQQLTFIWFYYLNLDSIVFTSDAEQLRDNLAGLSLRLPTLGTRNAPIRVSTYEVDTGLDKLLQETLETLFFTTQATLVGILPGLALLLFYVGLVVGVLVESKRAEIALMRSRGASFWQILLLSAIEAAFLCGLALFVAPLLAGQLAYFLTLGSFFGKVQGPVSLLLSVPTFQSYLFAGAAACCCLVALVVPMVAIAQSNLVALKGRIARPRRFPLWLRTLPALFMLALGLYGYVAARQHGHFFTENLRGEVVVDWVAATAPTLLYLGAAGLGLLLVAPLLRLLEKLGEHLPGVSISLGLREMARRPAYYSRLVLVLSVAISLGLLASFLNGTLATSVEDRAAYTSGADLRLVESSSTGKQATVADHLRVLPGVAAAMNALRVEATLQSTNLNTAGSVTALGVDVAQFQQVAYWRADFADHPLAELMRRLQTKTDYAELVPALVDDQLFAGMDAQPGAGLLLHLTYGVDVSLVIVGSYHLFPTLNTNMHTLVCDVSRLRDALKASGESSQPAAASNEFWLKLAPTAPRYTTDRVKHYFQADPQGKLNNVGVDAAYDRLALAEPLSNEPLHVAISAAFLLDFVMAALLSVLGFIVLFYLIARQRGFEFGVLRAFGLSLRQLAASLSWEQLILVLLAFLLGVPLGAVVASLVIPGLSVDALGSPLMPPFSPALKLQSAWQQGVFLGLCMSASLIVSILIYRRLRVQEALRLGEE